LKDPDVAKLIEAQAIEVVGSSPDAFASFIKHDIATWKDVARQAKVEVK
jgi:tripartite-type tricarboxylate transporter receptor subunit TctC